MEEERGKKRHAHDAPAVEGMQKAHGRLLLFRGAGFHDGGDQHFDEPAADGVEHHAGENPGIGPWKDIGKHGKTGKAGAGEQVCRADAFPVADAVHKKCGEKIDAQLNGKVQCGNQRDLGEGKVKHRLEMQEEQRQVAVDHGLGDISQIAGMDRVFITCSERGKHERTSICGIAE